MYAVVVVDGRWSVVGGRVVVGFLHVRMFNGREGCVGLLRSLATERGQGTLGRAAIAFDVSFFDRISRTLVARSMM